MKKAYAQLSRRPLLTPVWLAALALLAALVAVSIAVWVLGTADSTTVIVIRHAEKQLDAGDDPPLSQDGQRRADRLAQLFASDDSLGRIDAIYASPARRYQMTAAPLAARLKIAVTPMPADEPKALARDVLRAHPQGRRIMIVGQRDTVGPLVAALSGMHVAPAGDDEYGTIYIVAVPRIGHANVLKLHY